LIEGNVLHEILTEQSM